MVLTCTSLIIEVLFLIRVFLDALVFCWRWSLQVEWVVNDIVRLLIFFSTDNGDDRFFTVFVSLNSLV